MGIWQIEAEAVWLGYWDETELMEWSNALTLDRLMADTVAGGYLMSLIE